MFLMWIHTGTSPSSRTNHHELMVLRVGHVPVLIDIIGGAAYGQCLYKIDLIDGDSN